MKVVHKETKAPIAGAQVRLGIYGAETDESGSAIMRVPKGAFPLVVARTGYKMPERTIKVAKDIRVRITAETLARAGPVRALERLSAQTAWPAHQPDDHAHWKL